MQVRYGWRISRARQVLIPVLAGGHWTMLILQHSSLQAGAAAASSVPAPEEAPESLVGCSKCNYTGVGCSKCSVAKAVSYEAKLEKDRELFDCSTWPPLPAGGTWTARYYDPLPKASTCSKEAASRILSFFEDLGLPQGFPESEEGLRQEDSVSCGRFCLHWVESILRESRGEGPSLSAWMGKKDKLKLLSAWISCLKDKATTGKEKELASKASQGKTGQGRGKASASKPQPDSSHVAGSQTAGGGPQGVGVGPNSQ